MPITKLIAPFTAFHGTVGTRQDGRGQVAFGIGARNYARNYVRPANPQTAYQSTTRAALAASAQAFQQLTVNEKTAWYNLAIQVSRLNVFGESRAPSALQMYVMVNSLRQLDGQAITDAAPAFTSPLAPMLVDSLTATNETDGLSFDITHSNPDSVAFWLIRMSPPQQYASRNPRKSDFRLAAETSAASIVAKAPSPQSINLTTRFGNLTTGSFVALQVQGISSGYIPGATYNTGLVALSAP